MLKLWMAGLLALWSVGAWAEDQLCAVVVIELAQELTMEPQAFEATMRINNGPDAIVLDSLQVLFADEQNHPIKASAAPNASGKAFSLYLDDRQRV